MPELVPEAGPSSEWWEQEPGSPPSSPTRAIADPDDRAAAESLWSTGDQASSDSDLPRENVDDSDMDTASGDCITCSDTDEVSVWTAHERYQKRVWASCRLSRGSLWMEAQLKRISENCQDMWGHDHECGRAEQKCDLAEDCKSFEMWKMMIRTDQLLYITEATGSKIYATELEAKTNGKAKTLVLLLKQYHTYHYWFYEKGTMRAMVGLPGLHTSDAFQCCNVSASVGLKSFCPWCFKLRGNMETIATHLREVH